MTTEAGKQEEYNDDRLTEKNERLQGRDWYLMRVETIVKSLS